MNAQYVTKYSKAVAIAIITHFVGPNEKNPINVSVEM